MQRITASLKFVNSKCDNFHLLCVGGLSLITSDQDESIWKILAMEN